MSALRLQWNRSIAEIERNRWNALALPAKTPFLEWDWLDLLERSGSVGGETGWVPTHLTVWRGKRLVAAAALYIKGHSEGEFIFDWAWDDVSQKLSIPYYPKLVGMCPFTPVPGYRFLMAPEEDEAEVTARMLSEINAFCGRHGLSGSHFNYVDPGWRHLPAAHGYSTWVHQSFRWENREFRSFDDYLALFRTNQRRNIRRERRAISDLGISVDPLAGDEIPPDYFPLMYRFYSQTNAKFGPWGCKYLTPAFFDGLHGRFRHRLVLMAARESGRESRPLGMSLLVTKGDHLYGRYWGSFRSINALHFNACYYGPIQWAIENGIKRFDPGIGGLHKVRRGFVSVPNHSLHLLHHPYMRRIMHHHMDEINRLEKEQIDETNAELPFVRSRSGP